MRSFLLYLMPFFLVASSVAHAADVDAKSLEGEHWYGLYMAGQKVGYLMEKVEVADDGSTDMIQDAVFKLNMGGLKQDMAMYSKRSYGPDGNLASIESEVQDMSGKQRFRGQVEGDLLVMHSEVGGRNQRKEYPVPDESLDDALQSYELLEEPIEIGKTIEFSIFEPMYEREISATSTLMGKEERLFDGVTTEVYHIKTTMAQMGVNTESWVLADGTRVEDRIAGLIVMRLEPKEVAQDITYVNDTIISNAAMVPAPIRNARSRERLELVVSGPLGAEHLFSDGGQTFESVGGDAYNFVRALPTVSEKTAPLLPITEGPHAAFIEPTLYVQSDHPRLQQTAREIVGDETNAWAVSEKLTHWVYDNVESTYSARLSNSLDVLETLEGDCTEHSMLFIGLARALGLPAKEIAGLIYSDQPEPGFYFHQWASVWVGEWIDVDPTFNQPIADTTHVKLSEGDLSKQIQLLPIIGQLRVEVVD